MQVKGFLTIWSDLAPEDETDWTHWMTREHSSERVSVEGFLACRIFRALGIAVNRYFILYELDSPEVVGGPAYLARLNSPTRWSQSRGGGRVLATEGVGQGGLLAVLPLPGLPEWEPDGVCKEIAAADRIAAARILVTDIAQTLPYTYDRRTGASVSSARQGARLRLLFAFRGPRARRGDLDCSDRS